MQIPASASISACQTIWFAILQWLALNSAPTRNCGPCDIWSFHKTAEVDVSNFRARCALDRPKFDRTQLCLFINFPNVLKGNFQTVSSFTSYTLCYSCFWSVPDIFNNIQIGWTCWACESLNFVHASIFRHIMSPMYWSIIMLKCVIVLKTMLSNSANNRP